MGVLAGAVLVARPGSVRRQVARILTKNIADSEVLNEASQIVLKIDFVNHSSSMSCCACENH